MTSFRSRVSAVPLVAIAALLAIAAAGCGGSSSSSSKNSGGGGGGGGKVEVCVLLPDTKSSVRYELFDRPYLNANFKAAGVKAQVLNALGDQNT
jgi:hypothetical protein